MTKQRFDVETNIAPPMRMAITLAHKSGLVIYVVQSAFGPKATEDELLRVARRVATALEETPSEKSNVVSLGAEKKGP